MAARPSAAASQAAAREMWSQLEASLRGGERGEAGALTGATPAGAAPLAPLLAPLAALHAARQRLGDISPPQAALLVEAMQRLLATGSAEAVAESWPQALELLGRWARGGSSSSSSGGTGESATTVPAVLEAGSNAVLHALSARALPPPAVGAALAFLGAAAGRPGAPSALAATSAAVAALHDLGPAVADPAVLPGIVAGVQQLLEACLNCPPEAGAPAAGGPAPWLLTSLLQAAASHVPTRIAAAAPRAAAAAAGAGCPSTRFVGSMAAAAEAAAAAGALCSLYALGRRLAAAALLRPVAGPGAAPSGGTGSTAGVEAVAGLLEAGCREGVGDLLAAALCATAGAGLVDGVLASAPQLRASAGTASAGGLAQPPFALPASHPLAAPCMRLFAGVARVAARCAEATNSLASPPAVAATAPGSMSTGEPLQAAGQHTASVAASCVGFAYSQLLRTHGAVVPAQPTAAGLLCALGAVLDNGLSPAALYWRGMVGSCSGSGCGDGTDSSTDCPAAPAAAAAAAAATPSAAGGKVGLAAVSPLEQEVGPIARWAAEWAARAPSEARLRVAARLHHAARRTAGGYARYAAAAAPEALAAGPQAAAVKNLMDRTFAVHVALACSLWPPQQQYQQQQQQSQSAGNALARAVLVATVLATFARLQFCRLQLPQYSDLMRGLVGEAAASPAAAERLLIFCSKYRAELAAAAVAAASGDDNGMGARSGTVDSHSSSSSSASGDGAPGGAVSAATLAFLLPLLPIALRAARDPGGAAADAAVPLILLAVAQPAAPVALAAHSAFAGALSACAARGCGTDLAERAAPAYVRACAEAWPAAGSYEGMQLGFHFLWQQLPSGSGAGLLALQQLCDRAAALAAGGAAGISGDKTAAQGSREALAVAAVPEGEAASRLFALVIQGLMSIDFQQLPAALVIADGLLARVPGPVRREWVADARAVVLASTNAVTKHALVAWVQAAAAAAAVAGPRSRL